MLDYLLLFRNWLSRRKRVSGFFHTVLVFASPWLTFTCVPSVVGCATLTTRFSLQLAKKPAYGPASSPLRSSVSSLSSSLSPTSPLSLLASQSSPQSGFVERFRISNPFKVPCDVRIYLVPVAEAEGTPTKDKKTTATQGESKDKDGQTQAKSKKDKDKDKKETSPTACGAFDAYPSTLHLPTLESRYVAVAFTPTALQSYACKFKAVVDSGTDAKTRELVFELRGDGTLPHLSVSSPTLRDENTNNPIVEFSRVFVDADVDRSVTLPIVVRNEVSPCLCSLFLRVVLALSGLLSLFLHFSSGHCSCYGALRFGCDSLPTRRQGQQTSSRSTKGRTNTTTTANAIVELLCVFWPGKACDC